MMGCSLFYGVFLVNSFKTFARSNMSDGYLTLVGGIGGAMNGVSRFIWALMLDFFGFPKVYGLLLIIQVI